MEIHVKHAESRNARKITETPVAAVDHMNCQSIAHHAKNQTALHVVRHIPQLQKRLMQQAQESPTIAHSQIARKK